MQLKKFLPKMGGGLLKNLAIDLVLLLLAFWGLGKWQTRALLSADGKSAAPVVTLSSVDGSAYTLGGSSDKGSVIYFFAPWCSVCGMNNEQLEAFKQSEAQRTAVYAVALDYTSPAQVQQYAADHGLTSPVLLGDTKIQEAYKVSSYPTFYFIDKNGMVQNHALGFTTRWGLMWRR